MAEQYIEKSIDTPCGVPALAWDGTLMVANLESGKAIVSLLGYVDEAALAGSQLSLEPKDVTIENILTLPSYEDVFTELATKLLTDPASQWYGGSIEPCPIDVHGRLLVKPVVTDSGATASCWRCARLTAELKEDSVELQMVGYKDIDSFCNGKPPITGKRPIRVRMVLSTITTYPALYAEILAEILAGEVFSGGIVKEIGG